VVGTPTQRARELGLGEQDPGQGSTGERDPGTTDRGGGERARRLAAIAFIATSGTKRRSFDGPPQRKNRQSHRAR